MFKPTQGGSFGGKSLGEEPKAEKLEAKAEGTLFKPIQGGSFGGISLDSKPKIEQTEIKGDTMFKPI